MQVFETNLASRTCHEIERNAYINDLWNEEVVLHMTCSTKSIREKYNLKSYTKCDIVYDSSKGAFPQHHMVHHVCNQ